MRTPQGLYSTCNTPAQAAHGEQMTQSPTGRYAGIAHWAIHSVIAMCILRQPLMSAFAFQENMLLLRIKNGFIEIFYSFRRFILVFLEHFCYVCAGISENSRNHIVCEGAYCTFAVKFRLAYGI